MKTIAIVLILTSAGMGAFAQTPPRKTTLREAREMALRASPRVASANYLEAAARQVVIEARSALFPNITSNVTAVDALDSSRIAAGGLNNPVIYSRLAGGIGMTQLLTDFGRTSNLTESSRL